MTVGADVFLDTNIILYAALGQGDEQRRFEIARRIVLLEDYCTSAQVLAEFYVNVQKKGAPPLSAEEAGRWVHVLSKKPCQPVDADIVRSGAEFSRRYRISYWDGAVLAAAERLGAHTLYTENLDHGRSYGSVRVVNPFLDAEPGA